MHSAAALLLSCSTAAATALQSLESPFTQVWLQSNSHVRPGLRWRLQTILHCRAGVLAQCAI